MSTPIASGFIPPCLLRGASHEEYHADDFAEVPTLSASIAKIIANRSARHAYEKHPQLGGGENETTEAMSLGTIVHSLLLGAGPEIVKVDANDWRAKAAQEERKAIREAGQIPVLLKQYQEAEQIVKLARPQLAEQGIVLDGESEIVALWNEDSECGEVLCRGLLDHLRVSQGQIVDLKTSSDANPRQLGRKFVDFGYEVQAAAYTSAIEHIFPDLAGRVTFTFVFIETEAPYIVQRARASGTMRALGESKWRRAVEIWARALATGVWPAYSDAEVEIEAPSWALYQEDQIQEGSLL